MKKKKINLPKNQLIGVTESGEIAYNLDAFRRLRRGNIIISKTLTDALIEKLIKYKEKIILHLTVTGFGGTRIEPLVPSLEQTYKKFLQLIEQGFPIKQVVLRVDPIVPSQRGIDTAISVLKRFEGLGISRVRISFLDNYSHVRERFKAENIDVLYNGKFHAPLYLRTKYLEKITDAAKGLGFDNIEICGEPQMESIPCLSQRDIDILGLSDEIKLIGSAEQRGACKCPSNKYEILKVKPHRCENSCLYCYWRDEKKPNIKNDEYNN